MVSVCTKEIRGVDWGERMVCFSCFSPGGNGVRRIEIESGTRSGSRHSADSTGLRVHLLCI